MLTILGEDYEQIYVHCQGPDAKLCIEELASRGQEACRATKQETVLCRKGNTVITSQVIGKSEDTVTSCGNVAVSAGRIMDKCYHQDNTVVGFAIAMGTYTFRVDIRPE
ncbi:unnamed protein product [Clonostachys rosea f. rosea IK726]|uniref:Uncharacterized protein n=1 Tax=Clonostachys rosea f. rosea IK726 TaxID=1349383 RepID=A0ACA9UJ26_BIOOC|nr:unnamed protein product [Clonostachys rosea f. rosea IK726]